MANKAGKIVGPILAKAHGSNTSPIDTERQIRAALEGRAHLCVIEDWAHEPGRRTLMRLRWHRGSTKFHDRRRHEVKVYAKKKSHSRMQKISRAIGRFFARLAR